MYNIHMIIPTFQMDREYNIDILKLLLERFSIFSGVTIVEQNGSYAECLCSVKVKHLSVEVDDRNMHRGLILNKAVNMIDDHIYESLDYLWINDLRIVPDSFELAINEICGEDYIQPYTHLSRINKRYNNDFLKKGSREGVDPKYNRSDNNILPKGSPSFLIKADIFKKLEGFDLTCSGTPSEYLDFQRKVIVSGYELTVFWLGATYVTDQGLSKMELWESEKRDDDLQRLVSEKISFHIKSKWDYDIEFTNELQDCSKLLILSKGSREEVNNINRFEDFLGGYILCINDREDAVSACLKTNKKVIPVIRIPFNKKINPKDYVMNDFSKIYQDYIQWICNNSDQFEFIICSNYNWEACGPVEYYQGYEELFPLIADKITFVPIEFEIEKEAYDYKDSLAEAPLRKYFMQRGHPIFSLSGFWPLYKNIFEMSQYGVLTNNSLTSMFHNNKGHDIQRVMAYHKPKDRMYPFTYFRNYIKDLSMYSGVAYANGASQDNVTKLIQYGYKGCLFDMPNNDKDMGSYLKNISQWSEVCN